MTLASDFTQGMYQEIRQHFAEIVLPAVAKRTELRDKLARLEGQLKSYEEQLARLPWRKDALLRDVSKALAEGEDALPLRREIRGVEQEMVEIKEIVATVEVQAIPQTKQEIDQAYKAITQAIAEAGYRAREVPASTVRTAFLGLLDADQAWFDAFQKALKENGLESHASNLDGYVRRLLPAHYNLRAQIDAWT